MKPLGISSMRKNFLYMLFGNASYALSQWGILIVLAKLGTSQMVGQFTLGLAVAAPIILLTDLQLRSVLATDAKRENSYSEYITLKGLMSVVALVILGVCLLWSGYPKSTAMIIFVIGLSKIIETFCEVNYGLFQKNEKMGLIARSLMSRGILSLLTIVICIRLNSGLLTAVLALTLSWFVVLILLDFRAALKMEQLRRAVHFLRLKELFFKSLPLGFVTMMLSLNINIPRYVLERFAGASALGYFSALSYILISGNILVTALGQTASSRLAFYFSQQNFKEFKRILGFLIGAGLIIGVGGFLVALTLGEFLLEVFYRKDYSHYHTLFALIMFSGVFLYTSSFLGFALTAMRKFKIQPYLASAWSLVTFLASIWFIPRYGLEGAAYAGIASAVFQFLSIGTVLWMELAKTKKVQLKST